MSVDKKEEKWERTDKPQWYVVHTYSGYENKVKADLEKTISNRKLQDQMLQVVVPMQEVEVITSSKRQSSKNAETAEDSKTTEGKASGESEPEALLTEAEEKESSEKESSEKKSSKKKSSEKKERKKKLFPSYVFIQMYMTDDTWYVVRNTRGVTGFVGPESKPVPLTQAEIDAMFSEAEKVKQVISYQKDDMIEVIAPGPFQGTVAPVVAVDEELELVTVRLVDSSTETTAEFSFADVKWAES